MKKLTLIFVIIISICSINFGMKSETERTNKKMDKKALAKVEQMMKALSGFKNWVEVKSLYVQAIHKEDRF